MLWRAIALVALKAIAGMRVRQFQHYPVARHLGHHGSRRDGKAFGIALHNRFTGQHQKLGHMVAVNQAAARLNLQRLHRLHHRPHGGLKDIVPVNARHIGNANANNRPLHDARKKGFALVMGELF